MFYSVLFPDEAAAALPLRRKAPECFRDLNLQNVVDTALRVRKDFDLGGY